MNRSNSYKLIDAHIHLDWYEESGQQEILTNLEPLHVESLIAVSSNLQSAKKVLDLYTKDKRVKPAIGYHPEQDLPEKNELDSLFKLIEQNANKLIAIGEVGLPYYLSKENLSLQLGAYYEILEQFIKQAKLYHLPIVLHAVYEDAKIVMRLLKAYKIKKAHFHWFKGDDMITKEILAEGYYISFTPDIVYNEKTRRIVELCPLEQMMVETDGPWSFTKLYGNALTTPSMLNDIIEEISKIKNIDKWIVQQTIYKNTKQFYNV